MFLIGGLLVVFGSIVGGYVMHHGKIGVLIQLNEFLIIGGAALGSLMIANPPGTLRRAVTSSINLLKPNPYSATAYSELLHVLYTVFQKARKDGLIGLEAHIEDPHSSELFRKFPTFLHHEHAVSTLCDTIKVLLTGTVENHLLSEILDLDLEQQHNEAMAAPLAISKVADALPDSASLPRCLASLSPWVPLAVQPRRSVRKSRQRSSERFLASCSRTGFWRRSRRLSRRASLPNTRTCW